jgi:predicted kinase
VTGGATELFCLPNAPDYEVAWTELDTRFEWIRDLRGVQQDPVWHAEGDVWVHTHMVCEALVGLSSWRALQPEQRNAVWLAALLHDVAKPHSTREEGGRIRSPHHSTRGAVQTRRILWESGIDVAMREQVCGLIRHHQLPVHATEGERSEQRMSAASLRCSLPLLAILAEADIRGRVCEDAPGHLQSIALFEEYAMELNCWEGPRQFPSDHTRMLFFTENRPAQVDAFDDTQFTVQLLCGLPGAGKSHWLATQSTAPLVSLDAIRHELGIAPTDNQGVVRAESIERARIHLRAKESFRWDATNLTRERRTKLIRLFRDYGARVEIVAVEAAFDKLWTQNKDREQVVPSHVIERMMRGWEFPDATEAHKVMVVGV